MKSFSQKDTKALKGIAILLMLLHHMLFVNRQPSDLILSTTVSINGTNLFSLLLSYSKICVSIFMFLGGYGYYCLIKDKSSQDVFNLLLLKIKKLYFEYWKVFLIFVPIGFIFFNNQKIYCSQKELCTIFSNFNRIAFITNFLCIFPTYNCEWWFFKTYIIALFSGSIVYFLFLRKSDNVFIDFFSLSVISVLLIFIFPNIGSFFPSVTSSAFFNANSTFQSRYIPLFFWGMFFCKYAILSKFKTLACRRSLLINIILGFCLTIICVVLREYYYSLENSFDVEIMIIPVQIIAFLYIFVQLNIIWKAFQFIGRYSTTMWLTHTFFCYYFEKAARLVYLSRNIIIDYLTLLSMTLVSSILISIFWKKIGKLLIKAKLLLYKYKIESNQIRQ